MHTRRIRARLASLNCEVWAGQSGFALPVSMQTASLSLLGLHGHSGCAACHSNSRTAQRRKNSPDSRSKMLNYFLKGQKWSVLINPKEHYSTLCPFSRNMYCWFCSLLPTGITCAFPLPSCCCHSLKSICCFTRWSVILLKRRGVLIACTPIV